MPVKDVASAPAKKMQSEDDVKVVRRIKQRLLSMSNARKDFEADWKKENEAYELSKVEGKKGWQAKGRSVALYAICEGIWAELRDSYPDVGATPAMDDLIPAYLVKPANLVLHAVLRYGENALEREDVLKDCILHGTGVVKTLFEHEMREYKFLQMDDTEKKPSWKSAVVTEKYGCSTLYVPLENFFLDEYAPSMQKARDCIETMWMPYEDFKRCYDGPMFKNVDLVQARNRTTQEAGVETDPHQQREKSVIDTEGWVFLLHYWSRFDERIIIANDVNVCETPNPFADKKIPFDMLPLVRIPNSPYGRGIGKAMESPQEHLSTMQRVAIDRTKIISSPPTVASTQLGLEDQDWEMRPDKLINVDGPADQVQPIRFGDLSDSVWRLNEALNEEARQASGYDNRLLAGAQGQVTLGEYTLRKESQMKRVAAMVATMERWGYLPMAQKVWSRIQQFYTKKHAFRAYNTQTRKVETIPGYPTVFYQGDDKRWQALGIDQTIAQAIDSAWLIELRTETDVGRSRTVDRQNAINDVQILKELMTNPTAQPGEDPRVIDGKKLAMKLLEKLGENPADYAPDTAWNPPAPQEPPTQERAQVTITGKLTDLPPDKQAQVVDKKFDLPPTPEEQQRAQQQAVQGAPPQVASPQPSPPALAPPVPAAA